MYQKYSTKNVYENMESLLEGEEFPT